MKTSAFKITDLFFDIRIWIFVLFLIRLENIDLAPYETHSWRQTFTLGVSRGFMEVDANIFHPRTIVCDSRNGIIAQEFPIFNYAIYLLWEVFGEHNWVYRLFNLLVCSIGLYYFAKVSEKLAGPKTGLPAAVIFGVSIAFMYARKAMPDVFAVSLVIMGVYYALRYLDTASKLHLVLFGLFTGMGLLSKMPAMTALGLLVGPLLLQKPGKKAMIDLGIAGGIAIALMVAWYFIWVPWAESEYQNRLFFPLSVSDGLKELAANWQNVLGRFHPIALSSNIASVFCLAGVIWMFRTKNRALQFSLAASALLILNLMIKSGSTFSGHEYYVIPFVPIMSVLAAYGLVSLVKNRWWMFAILVFISTEAIYKHKHDFFLTWEQQRMEKLEAITNQYVPKDSRVLVNNDGPVMMYAVHRRGWSAMDRLDNKEWMDGESTVGMHYAIIDRSKKKEPLPYPMLFEDNDFWIFKIKKD